MTRVAVTAGSPDLDQAVDTRFGRAAFILLVDPDTLHWESVENPGRDARGGAGIQVAQFLSKKGVTDVVSGEFGPKAQEALGTAGIRMYCCGARTRVREAVELLNAGKLEPAAPRPESGRGRRGRWR